MTSEPILYAVRLPAILTPESQDSYVFVGVRCKVCGVAYSVALPNAREQHNAISEARHWAEQNMGECGAHPAVLFTPELMEHHGEARRPSNK